MKSRYTLTVLMMLVCLSTSGQQPKTIPIQGPNTKDIYPNFHQSAITHNAVASRKKSDAKATGDN